MRIPVFGLVVVFTLLSASAEAQDPDNRLTLDLYLEYESVSDPRLSPDGQQVIYSRQWIDKVNDRRESSLWIMDVDGSRNRFLVEGSGARWSPSGTASRLLLRENRRGPRFLCDGWMLKGQPLRSPE